ncbi:peptidyl-prolyl cis-trans isomerase D [Paracoccus halophilus]|uniref:Peptidyl-prolyl cis-trans isomerase D n=1 Tax=Paracoccus halophilus TaxID=376733 RepID=A0A099F5E0_9RHOB|nr:peptidylprolyl isomerase [Paracoccus halophilus]KGJ05945.1 peptidylprolyl isomerase [Paracoccus halophilus]SFA53793.1 peptidyl-prolyl cis-trans isomerase D [Paracoccus halophilus]
MRGKGRSTIVWVLMGMLILGLGGFGVTNFSGGSTDIGAVGQVEVTSDDYRRMLNAEMQEFAARTGRQLSPAEARAIGIEQSALARLFTAAALENEARQIGVSVGDQPVLKQIAADPGFRGLSGNFDREVYADELRRLGYTEAEYEHDLRMDEARSILLRAALAGVVAPQPVTSLTQGWLLETRDIHWRELTAEDLPEPIAQPDDATLEAWHQANADRFTSPEIRKITFAWLTPEMLEAEVEVNEEALRDLYDSRIADYRQPERRMVERLVFPTMAAAEDARARLDRGEATFEELAAERGLTLEDIDLGEVAEADLGAAGAAVFALDAPGIAGPASSDLGPALFSMNAILEPVDIPYEQARADLRLEAAVDRARREIEDSASDFSDRLAGGATLEDLADETPMELGRIDWTANAEADPGGIDAYPEFREKAAQITERDFPELFELEDGGVFALRLDAIEPPALIPFAEVRDRVAEDWTRNETIRQLRVLAEEQRVRADAVAQPVIEPAQTAATDPVAQAAGVMVDTPASAEEPGQALGPGQAEIGLERGGFIADVPQEVVTQAFEIAEPGQTEIVDAAGRVFLVTLDAVHPAETDSEEARQVRDGIEARLADSMRQDVFEYFTRALQTQGGVTLNQTAIDAENARLQ